MSDQSTHLPETSKPTSPFGKKEIDYLTRVEAAMQNLVQTSTVKMWLEKAQADGVDPLRIYEAAVQVRPPHWTPAPPFSDVAPPPKPAPSLASEMLTPSELAQLQRKREEINAVLRKAYPTVTILTD